MAQPAAAFDGAIGPVEAYASFTSALPLQTVSFYARDSGGSLTPRSVSLNFYKVGVVAPVLSTSTYLAQQTVPSDTSTNGCRWPPLNIAGYGTSFTIPSAWTTGLYYAEFDGGNQTTLTRVYFVVKPATRTSTIAFQIEFLTAQAYNNYGGKSLYDFNSTGGRASQVSLDRPIAGSGWADESSGPILQIIPWLQANGIAVDFFSSIDLHENPGLFLPGYQLFMTVGHDEYWTMQMRNNLDGAIYYGLNAAFLSGNNSWWQARLQPNTAGQVDRVLVCYKDFTDPIYQSNPDLTTANFWEVGYPENQSLGLGTRAGGENDNYTTEQTPYKVYNAGHWAYANTGLSNGMRFWRFVHWL